MGNQPFRWGILGLGSIAHSFATGLQSVSDAQLAAVGSRTQEKADLFGEKFNVPKRYARYEDLATDPEIDAVYIATPHPMHFEETLLCINAGKAVLCEKPFTLNALQTEEIIRVARENRIFVMEAMWTRFLPILQRTRSLIKEGAIGEARMLHADFGYRTGFNAKARHFDPALGGGALLDVGVYPISLASFLFGTPSEITGIAQLGETGIDEQSAMLLGHPGGQIAVLSTAIRTTTAQEALIYGAEGHIRLHAPWWKGERLTLARNGHETEDIHLPLNGNGYNYEAEEVARCVRAGLLESETMPLDETLQIMKTMDSLRAQWGMRYPQE